jgi:hypothetical protein
MASLEMIGNVSIHARPVKTLHQSFFGLVDSVMTSEKLTVGFCHGVGSQGGW